MAVLTYLGGVESGELVGVDRVEFSGRVEILGRVATVGMEESAATDGVQTTETTFLGGVEEVATGVMLVSTLEL